MGLLSDAFAKAPPARAGVQKTSELARILALPRRKLDLDAGTIDGQPILDLNSLYTINPGKCEKWPKCPVCMTGKAGLWPTQCAALSEAERGWGLFGPMGVGSGKTAVSLLLADVFAAKKAVLLVPPSLKNQLITRDFFDYGRHFKLPLDRITVVSYSELSVATGAFVLDRVEPDLIIADEVHNLARVQSARTKRFIRYMQTHPGTRFCGLSGTITRRSLRDYSHLCEISLRHGSPIPYKWSDLQEWADALDPIRDPIPIGALKIFVNPSDPRLKQGPDEAREAAREGFRKRLVETTGVVATGDSWEGASLIVKALRPAVPKSIQIHIANLFKTWEIGGEEIEEKMRLTEVARQLALGFYYRWVWPKDVPDREWLEARAAWHKCVRLILQRSRSGMDSPLLVSRAVKAGLIADWEIVNAWQAWQLVKDRPSPPVEPVWIDDFAIQAALAWGKAQIVAKEPGIIWYSHTAVGDALSSACNGKYGLYGSGADAGEADPEQEPIIICSIRAQGTGKNLQRYARSLVMEPSASGATNEQLLGRTHRPNQQADDVIYDVFMHTPELEDAMLRAVADALYVQQTQGQRQKLLVARRVNW